MASWYFGKMDRFEAMNHLLSPENAKGAFLIRLSEKDSVGHVLSGKEREGGKEEERKRERGHGGWGRLREGRGRRGGGRVMWRRWTSSP